MKPSNVLTRSLTSMTALTGRFSSFPLAPEANVALGAKGLARRPGRGPRSLPGGWQKPDNRGKPARRSDRRGKSDGGRARAGRAAVSPRGGDDRGIAQGDPAGANDLRPGRATLYRSGAGL